METAGATIIVKVASKKKNLLKKAKMKNPPPSPRKEKKAPKPLQNVTKDVLPSADIAKNACH